MPWYLRRLILMAIAEGGGAPPSAPPATPPTAAQPPAPPPAAPPATPPAPPPADPGLLGRATPPAGQPPAAAPPLAGALDATILTTNKDLKALFDQELGKRAPTLVDGKLGDIAVPAKFLNSDGTLNVANVLKSQMAAEAKLPKAATFQPPAKPEDYKLVPSDKLKAANITGLDMNDPVTKGFVAVFHKHGIPQEAFNDIATVAYEMAAESGTVDPKAVADAEFAKLGPNAQAIVDGISGWLGGLKTAGYLSDGELAEAQIMAGTADGARVMLKLRELAGEQSIDLKGAVMDGLPSVDEFYSMMGATVDNKPGGQTRYVVDDAYRAKLDDIANKLFGNAPAGTSRPGLGGINPTGGLAPARMMNSGIRS